MKNRTNQKVSKGLFWVLFFFVVAVSCTFGEEKTYLAAPGKITRQQLEQDSIFKPVFKKEYAAFHPVLDSFPVNLLQKHQVVIILGTWCPDSWKQVPRFFKVLDEAGYDQPVDIYVVDRKREAGNVDLSRYHPERIPTFIFYENGRESGRITERPAKSLVVDIQHILKDSLD
jgi:hypothetical protein